MSAQSTAAVVVGAAGGIGEATATRLSNDGAYDYIGCFDVDPSVEEVAHSIDGGLAFEVDVSDIKDAATAVNEVEQKADITAVVNMAAVFGSKDQQINEISSQEWDEMLGVNLKGQFNVVQAAVPAMQERGTGSIINVSSMAGKKGSAVGGAHYSASKSGIFGLTKGLAKQLSPEIRVNCITPGLIDTPKIWDTWEKDEAEAFKNRLPMSRLGEPSEVAALIRYLCSEEASYITGAIIDIDGGSRLM